MDLSKAEKIEIDAHRQRYNHLAIIAEEKKCGLKYKHLQEEDEETTIQHAGAGTP